jgi:rubrerythrin
MDTADQLPATAQPTEAQTMDDEQRQAFAASTAGEREIPCPVCGHPMPDLKGGKDSICPVCGFKDSCCY